jgi:hypothetical protein
MDFLDSINKIPLNKDVVVPVGRTNCRHAERQCQSRIVEKTKDVEREDLWRFVMNNDLISLSIDN